MPTIVDLNVTINITHPIDEELDIVLIAPDGTMVDLSTDNGGAGDNYTNTIFDDAAGIMHHGRIAAVYGHVPAREQPLAALFGKPVAGTWTLRITDDTDAMSSTGPAGRLESCQFQTPLMVVIDTVEPNTPLLGSAWTTPAGTTTTTSPRTPRRWCR